MQQCMNTTNFTKILFYFYFLFLGLLLLHRHISPVRSVAVGILLDYERCLLLLSPWVRSSTLSGRPKVLRPGPHCPQTVRRSFQAYVRAMERGAAELALWKPFGRSIVWSHKPRFARMRDACTVIGAALDLKQLMFIWNWGTCPNYWS